MRRHISAMSRDDGDMTSLFNAIEYNYARRMASITWMVVSRSSFNPQAH